MSLPVVEPLQRALHLRSLDLFADLGGHELALFAALMREQWLRRGDVLHAPGRRVPSIFLLVEGRVRLEQEGSVRTIEAPGGVGLVELLAQIETPTRAVAETNALALVIDSGVFLEALEETFALFLHLRSALGRAVRDLWRAQRLGEGQVEGFAALPAVPEGGLDLVQQLLRLHRVPSLRRFGAGVLAALLRDQGEMRLEGGETLWTEEDRAEFFLLVVSGELSCSMAEAGEVFTAGPGTVLGMGAAFGGTAHFFGAVAKSPVVAIRVEVAALLDAAEDHFHVALEILAHSARTLLRLQQREVEGRKE